MVEEEKYILTQISAITKARSSPWGSASSRKHLNHCVVDAAAAGGKDAEVKLKEATDAIARLVRS